jgi:hypothetical protein
VWSGWQFPEEQADRKGIADIVDNVIASGPDIALVLRAATLLPEEIWRLRAQGIFTIAWFPDDPVLYEVQTSLIASHYDLTLHATTAAVLTLYESDLGVRGLAFPFWTDNVAFPRLYNPDKSEVDLVFIGNTHTRVKQWRYHWIAELPLSTEIHGLVKEDPNGIHRGSAISDKDLARAAARGRLGLSLSQRFSDYSGDRFHFPALDALGEYVLPSRIVQLAAVGVPIVSLTHFRETVQSINRIFPPVITFASKEELVRLAKQMRTTPSRLSEISQSTHSWFQCHFTAEARVRFLEVVLADLDKWTALPAKARATAFLSV